MTVDRDDNLSGKCTMTATATQRTNEFARVVQTLAEFSQLTEKFCRLRNAIESTCAYLYRHGTNTHLAQVRLS